MYWMLYVASTMGDDVQKKGVVIIWYGLNGLQAPPFNKGRGPIFFDLLLSSPIRIAAIHACYNDVTFMTRLNETAQLAESKYVVRLQTHFGGHQECGRNLTTFGIPQELIPINVIDGSFRREGYDRFIRQLQKQEEHAKKVKQEEQQQRHKKAPMTANDKETDKTTIEADLTASRDGSSPSPSEFLSVRDPGSKDIILGRGRRGDKSPGNMLLKRLLEDNYEAYDRGARIEKACIAHLIFFQMQQAGYRFLVPMDEKNSKRHPKGGRPNAWMEINEEAARHRIGHGFRNIRRTRK